MGSVISLWCLRSDRLNVTAQFISNDNSRLTIAGEQALEKAHRCFCVPSLLHRAAAFLQVAARIGRCQTLGRCCCCPCTEPERRHWLAWRHRQHGGFVLHHGIRYRGPAPCRGGAPPSRGGAARRRGRIAVAAPVAPVFLHGTRCALPPALRARHARSDLAQLRRGAALV